MKNTWSLTKFEVGISFIPFLLLVLFTGYYKLFFTYFFITLVHELGHVLMAKFFRVKVNKIKLSIFGFNAEVEDLSYLSVYKQILIIIAGPLTYFISAIILNKFYFFGYISLITYKRAKLSNLYILLFNLLPIYPLDGGRLIKLTLQKIFTYKNAQRVLYLLSFIFMVLFTIYTRDNKQYLMYTFLLINFVLNVISMNREWKSFLTKRYYFKNEYKYKLHNHKDLYVYKNNYVIMDKEILSEKEVIAKLLLH